MSRKKPGKKGPSKARKSKRGGDLATICWYVAGFYVIVAVMYLLTQRSAH